jgi:hypothetical protein
LCDPTNSTTLSLNIYSIGSLFESDYEVLALALAQYSHFLLEALAVLLINATNGRKIVLVLGLCPLGLVTDEIRQVGRSVGLRQPES